MEAVGSYEYLGLWLDSKLDWKCNMAHLYRKGQSRLYFLRRLQSLNICRKLLEMFDQTIIASVLFYTVVCWGAKTDQVGQLCDQHETGLW